MTMYARSASRTFPKRSSSVNIFFDTAVLVAASEQSHPHYAQAWPTLLRVAAVQDKGIMGLHSVAEVFAALTPAGPAAYPSS